MSRLRVRVFSGLSVVAGGRALPIAASCRPVLGYLLTNRQRHVSRLELAEALWTERREGNARRCLSTALWRLKRCAGEVALVAFRANDEVCFNWNAPVWVDCVALELRLAPMLRTKPEALARADLARLERGARLYRGDFLFGMDHEWACVERQRLRSLYCDSLYHLMTAYLAVQDWNKVLHWGRCLGREEPLREDVHRLLMLAYSSSGNRASAIAQYRLCERVLAKDLGVRPMAETRELLRRISHESRAQSVAERTTVPELDADRLHTARRRIVRVRQVLAASQQQLDRALDSLGNDGSKTRG